MEWFEIAGIITVGMVFNAWCIAKNWWHKDIVVTIE